MKLLSDARKRKNDDFVIFVQFCDASVQEANFFPVLYSVRQKENFCMAVGPEYKLEENKDRKTRNRLLRLRKSVPKCVVF